MKRKPYPSDLTDTAWAILEPLIPPAAPGGRPRKTDMRQVVNAIFYRNRNGCTWRALPHDFPPWRTVYIPSPIQYFLQCRIASDAHTDRGLMLSCARHLVVRDGPPLWSRAPILVPVHLAEPRPHARAGPASTIAKRSTISVANSSRYSSR